MTTSFDVAVIGAGPAGSVCARVLAQHGLDVALFGRLVHEAHRTGELISSGTRAHVPEIDQLDGVQVKFSNTAWEDRTEIRDLVLLTGRPSITAVRPALDQVLLSGACRAGAAHFQTPVVSCARTAASWQIRALDRDTAISAAFVIEATGRRGRSLAYADARRLYLDRLVVIWRLVAADGTSDDTMDLAACAQGWWYRVPSTCGRHFLALATDADLLPPGDKEGFFTSSSIGARFEAQVALGARITPLQVADARTSVRWPQSGPGWMPVGDAAYSLDPLSGDGVARAIADGKAIAKALIANADQINPDLELTKAADDRWRKLHELLTTKRTIYAADQAFANTQFWERRAVRP